MKTQSIKGMLEAMEEIGQQKVLIKNRLEIEQKLWMMSRTSMKYVIDAITKLHACTDVILMNILRSSCKTVKHCNLMYVRKNEMQLTHYYHDY